MKKFMGVICVLAGLLILLGIGVSQIGDKDKTENISKNETNIVVSSQKKIDITKLSFKENEIQLDVKETKDILLVIEPVEANIENLKFTSTNNDIIKIQKNIGKSDDKEVYATITPNAEGECEVYASSNEIQSNKIKIIVIDNERIEREKKAAEEEKKRQEAEEQAKREAEQKAAEEERKRQEAAEQAKKAEEEKKASQKQSSSSSNPQKETGSSTSNSRIVYRTPTGKRYHYLSTCGGKNSTATTLSAAIAAGLTPCQKCAN